MSVVESKTFQDASDLSDIFSQISSSLLDSSLSLWSGIEQSSSSLLDAAVSHADCGTADRAWFLHKVAATRFQYITCFQQIRDGGFYQAWCGLEQVEIGLGALKRNSFYDLSDFLIDDLLDRVHSWQQLYPYKYFCSPSYIVRESECNICGSDVTGLRRCIHDTGNVYCGRECHTLVKKATPVEISLVTNPVQKYSVPFLLEKDGKTIDQYNYSIVAFVAERLASPFDEWSAKWTAAHHPHNLFKNCSPDGECPCGSGRFYNACCLPKPGVMKPHLQVTFARAPSLSLPNAALVGYGQLVTPAILLCDSDDLMDENLVLKATALGEAHEG